MVLEAVMVVVDNSESSRNGDYQPTRFDSQADAANVIFQTITNSNPRRCTFKALTLFPRDTLQQSMVD
ncbi:26S proteasome regulatory subunit RPN10 like protein [Verticillium longisporum]|uniref:26S proteasome regulatory subunit RPN10 like protein n=1 Tax=Verticillium longisporum TaxID=100787 RepID=A0A8I2Z347_VERLO|nr:26S proteasome regulatory subunit RPN10 like protein [Verticillium longisporum]